MFLKMSNKALRHWWELTWTEMGSPSAALWCLGCEATAPVARVLCQHSLDCIDANEIKAKCEYLVFDNGNLHTVIQSKWISESAVTLDANYLPSPAEG